jgi:Na+/proline symporter
MSEDTLSEDRAKGIRRLLFVILGFTVVLVILALPLVLGSYVRYGLIVLGVALVLGIAGGLALRAVRAGSAQAKRLTITTGVLTIVLSVPLIPIWVGLLSAVAGIGLLVVTVAPERETQ